MHIAMIIGGGIVLLIAFVITGHVLGNGHAIDRIRAVAYFLPVWFVIALVNLWVGVSHAGYSVAQELPILAAVFGVPALAGALVMWITCRQ